MDPLNVYTGRRLSCSDGVSSLSDIVVTIVVLFARIEEQTSFCELCPEPPVAIRSLFHKSEASLKNVPSLKLASMLRDTGSRCCYRAEPGRAGVSCSRVFSRHHIVGTWAFRAADREVTVRVHLKLHQNTATCVVPMHVSRV